MGQSIGVSKFLHALPAVIFACYGQMVNRTCESATFFLFFLWNPLNLQLHCMICDRASERLQYFFPKCLHFIISHAYTLISGFLHVVPHRSC